MGMFHRNICHELSGWLPQLPMTSIRAVAYIEEKRGNCLAQTLAFSKLKEGHCHPDLPIPLAPDL
jgi:hypothetical protein